MSFALERLLSINQEEFFINKRKFIHKYETFRLDLELRTFSKFSYTIKLDSNISVNYGKVSLLADHVKIKQDKKSEILLKSDRNYVSKGLWDGDISERVRFKILKDIVKDEKCRGNTLGSQLITIESEYEELLLSMEDLVKTLIYNYSKKGVIKFKKKNYIDGISDIFISEDIIFTIHREDFSNSITFIKEFSELSYYVQCTIINRFLYNYGPNK